MLDKVVVVTGANGAIGTVLVNELVKCGYSVVACVRDIKNCSLNVTERISLFECDFASESSIKECTSVIAKENKVIYGIVNCVGIAHGASFLMTKPQDMVEVFKVNYFNILFFTQNLVKRMLKTKSGSIVNIASTSGILSDSGTTAYGGSKAALIHSSKVMANELGNFGIRVNVVAPAVIETPMSKLMDEKSLKEIDNRSFLKTKIYPVEVVNMITYLLGEQAVNITGQVFKIDRGLAS